MMPDASDNGSPPEVGVAFTVVVVIDTLDRLQIHAPEIPPDRVALILARAHAWIEREMTAHRTAEVLAERQRAITIPGGPVRLPPPPGR